jgi:hypothetical protein
LYAYRATEKNKDAAAAAAAAAAAGPNNFSGMTVSMAPGNVAAVQGIGQDPINALQNLTKQPLPAGMVQPGQYFRSCRFIVCLNEAQVIYACKSS